MTSCSMSSCCVGIQSSRGNSCFTLPQHALNWCCSPIHDHSGSCSWMKVLDGEIEEVQYSCNRAPVVTQTSTFLQDSVIFNDGNHTHTVHPSMTTDLYSAESVVHQIRNTKTGGHSVTLHIYSPPYAECNCFDPCCGQKHTVALDDLASHHDTKANTRS